MRREPQHAPRVGPGGGASGRATDRVRASLYAGVARAARDPVRLTDLVQTGKTALAAGLAWWVATGLWHLQMAFLAPWAAVLVVHSTVFRSVTRGTQQVLATFFAVFLAFALGSVIGTGPLSVGLIVLIGFLLGQVRWIRDEASTIATTGLVTLATGSIAQPHLLLSRLTDTSTGVVVGLLVNLVVWPPLRDRAAWAHVARLPHELVAVLHTMTEGVGPHLAPEEVEEWIRGLRLVDVHVDECWQLLYQAQESGRLNARLSQPAGLTDLRRLLHLLEQAVADALSMARTLAISAEDERVWDEVFRSRWRELVRRTADAVDAGEPAAMDSVGRDLDAFIAELAEGTLNDRPWQEYGGLLTNLRNTHRSLAQVIAFGVHADLRARRSRRTPPMSRARAVSFGRRGGGYQPGRHEEHEKGT